MKNVLRKNLISLLLLFLCVTYASASPLATFNYKIFYVPQRGTVVETYFDIAGRSVVLKDSGDGILKGQVQITTIFKVGEEIIAFDKKILDSPEMSASNIVDFLDVDRFILPPGTYDLEIQITDLFDPVEDSKSTTLEIIVPPTPPSGAFISDIQLVSAYKKTERPGMYSKSGYDILPMVDDDQLKEGMKELVFYTEIYEATEELAGDMFLVRAYIADTTTGEPMANTVVNLRRKAGQVTPIISRIPIADLKQGTYDIVIEVISKKNKLLAMKKMQVERRVEVNVLNLASLSEEDVLKSWVGKYDQKYVLFEYFQSLRPIANTSELNVMDNSMRYIEKVEMPYLQRYFYTFWETRDAENSEKAWLDYKANVDLAQDEFGTRNKRGYETDQGRIFLKYGAPNDISDRANEPSSYPYIIWHYFKAGKYNNVKFVFYDPMLLRQDYQLLHSEGMPGEVNNYRWQLVLKSRDTPQNNVDRTKPQEEFGGRADDYFNNPR